MDLIAAEARLLVESGVRRATAAADTSPEVLAVRGELAPLLEMLAQEEAECDGPAQRAGRHRLRFCAGNR